MQTRENLAAEAFSYTARYDNAIARWFAERQDDFPPVMMSAYEKVLDLSYGENPHQRAAYYAQVGSRMHVLSMVAPARRQGAVVQQRARPQRRPLAGGRVRAPGLRDHQAQQPVRRAPSAARRLEAYRKAFACDPQSAFGGVHLLQPHGRRASSPRRSPASSPRSSSPRGSPRRRSRSWPAKEKLRILEDNERRRPNIGERDLKRVMGGLLVQDRDIDLEDRSAMEVVTERKPTEQEWGEMLFAWKVCKHVRSNAIVLAKDLASVGIGAGQMSRVDSVRIAIEKAARGRRSTSRARRSRRTRSSRSPTGRRPRSTPACAASSSRAARVRDPEVVEAADAAGISMVFTHRRHFKH